MASAWFGIGIPHAQNPSQTEVEASPELVQWRTASFSSCPTFATDQWLIWRGRQRSQPRQVETPVVLRKNGGWPFQEQPPSVSTSGKGSNPGQPPAGR